VEKKAILLAQSPHVTLNPGGYSLENTIDFVGRSSDIEQAK